MAANLILKFEPYDPDAIDGDNDGIVQEGTAWERPAGTRLLLASGLEISRGETSAARPQGLRVVGANGNDIQYTPSWQKMQAPLQPGQSRTALADVGVRSLREMGLRDLRASTAPPKPAAAPEKPKAPAAETSFKPDKSRWTRVTDFSREARKKIRDPRTLFVRDKTPEERQQADLETGMNMWRMSFGDSYLIEEAAKTEFDENYQQSFWAAAIIRAIDDADPVGKKMFDGKQRTYRVDNRQFTVGQTVDFPLISSGATPEIVSGFEDFGNVVGAGAARGTYITFVNAPGVVFPEKEEREFILSGEFRVVKVEPYTVRWENRAGLRGKRQMVTMEYVGPSKQVKVRDGADAAENKKEEVDPRLERDWEDFSDLSNSDLNDLKNYVQDLLDDARSGAEEEKVADLRPKLRAMQAETKIRFNEFAAKERARQEATQASAWEELFGGDQPRFGRQVSRDSFGQLSGSEAAEVFAFLNEELRNAERISEDKRWELRDPEKWTKSDEYAKYSVLADLRNNLSIEILDKVKKDAEGVRGRVRDSQSLDRDGLDKLLTDLYSVEKLAEITANREVAEEVRKATKAIERRLKNGVGPAETRPAITSRLNQFIFGRRAFGKVRDVDVRRPTLADVGTDGLPTPKVFGENGNIRTAEQAIAHVRDGGSLQDVPNNLWPKVLSGLSSREEFDGDSMFREVEPSESGSIAYTRIYILRNPDGSPGNQGYVVKARIPEKDVASEVIGWNLAVAHGISTEGAMWAGKNAVVIPHVFNLVPDGKTSLNRRNYDEDLIRDDAFPAALGHFLHNYLLSLGDRHAGNGMIVNVQQGEGYLPQPFVIPIDQSWGNDLPFESMWEYARSSFWMHPTFLLDIRNQDLQIEPDLHRQTMENVYRETLERAEAVVAAGEEQFVERLLSGVPDTIGNPDQIFSLIQRTRRADESEMSLREAVRIYGSKVFADYAKKVRRMRDDQEEFVRLLDVEPNYDEFEESESESEWSG